MALKRLESSAVSATEVDSEHNCVCVIPVYNARDDLLQCFESFERHTPVTVPLLIVDDCGADKRALLVADDFFRDSHREVYLYERPQNGGFVGACNDAFRICSPHDVVLINSDVVLTHQWYERLKSAANSSNLIATVSTLTNHGTALSVPVRNVSSPQLPGTHTPDSAASRIAEMAIKCYPTIPTAIGHCVYIRRIALDIAGEFDDSFGRGYGEEVDFSQRAIRKGLKHICADDVFVFHRGGGSFGVDASSMQRQNHKVIQARYPWYDHIVDRATNDWYSPLTVALARASIALRGLRVAVDARILGPVLTGSQQVVLETIRSLANHPDVKEVTAYLPGPLPEYARDRLRGLSVIYRTLDQIPSHPTDKADIAYRPFQITSSPEITFLKSIGIWIAINQQDVIAFHNPEYFATYEDWFSYRRATTLGLQSVDGVAYVSRQSQVETRAEGLVSTAQSEMVIYNGTEIPLIEEAECPSELVGRGGPLLLVLGVSYHHKNRDVALRAFAEMRERGFNGTLILAGPTPPVGSTLGEESQLFMAHRSLREDVVQLGSVTEAQKRWLYENSTLLLYPTSVEGFGLIPFEAAQFGLATLSTRQGSLDEVLPRDIPTLKRLESHEVADMALNLLSNETLRRELVAKLRLHGARFTWSDVGARLVELFDQMTKVPPRRVLAIYSEDRLPTMWLPLGSESLVGVRPVPLSDSLMRYEERITVKRILIPAGSKRQLMIRKTMNRLRRYNARLRRRLKLN